jgi:hypothetical protein
VVPIEETLLLKISSMVDDGFIGDNAASSEDKAAGFE